MSVQQGYLFALLVAAPGMLLGIVLAFIESIFSFLSSQFFSAFIGLTIRNQACYSIIPFILAFIGFIVYFSFVPQANLSGWITSRYKKRWFQVFLISHSIGLIYFIIGLTILFKFQSFSFLTQWIALIMLPLVSGLTPIGKAEFLIPSLYSLPFNITFTVIIFWRFITHAQNKFSIKNMG